MATHGCVSYPCPVCHASAIQAAYDAIKLEKGPAIVFDNEEEACNHGLMIFMHWMKEWGLNCNETEYIAAIHTLQFFIFKHMLQRLGADFSDWYDNLPKAEG